VASFALLFATLIGVFITPDGIVVGADSAITSRSGQSTRQKYCVTGPRAVSTLQGVYELTDTETKATVALYDEFREWCGRIDRTQLPATLRGQAQFIAEALRTVLDDFLEDVPAVEIVRQYGSNPVVARIAVSGYDEHGPGSVVVGLGIATDRATNRWETQIRNISNLTFQECGARFHGQEVVILSLRNLHDLRVPKPERHKPEVEKLRSLASGSCSDASTKLAPHLFAEGARLTVAYGKGFGIQPGVVNLPLDIIVIPKTGTLDVIRLNTW
jgi:hypothetical protein